MANKSLFFFCEEKNIKEFENVIRVSGLTFFSSTVDTISIRNVCLLREHCTKINPWEEQIFFAGCAASAAWLCWCLTQDRHNLSPQPLLPFWVRARVPMRRPWRATLAHPGRMSCWKCHPLRAVTPREKLSPCCYEVQLGHFKSGYSRLLEVPSDAVCVSKMSVVVHIPYFCNGCKSCCHIK